MITSDWIYLACTALLLVLLNAIFVTSEFSLIKLRYSHFNPDLLEELRKSKRFTKIFDQVDRTLRFLRLGITFSTALLGVVLFPLVDHLASVLGFSTDGLLSSAVFCLAFVFVLSVHYVLGELVPRALALQHPVGAL